METLTQNKQRLLSKKNLTSSTETLFAPLNLSKPIDSFLFEQVKVRALPKHVALIMDGNRRWASQHYLPVEAGHWKGAGALPDIIRLAGHLKIETLTVYAFSRENWGRSENELSALFRIFKNHLEDRWQMMVDEGVRFHVIGDRKGLSQDLNDLIDFTMQRTCQGKNLNFVVAMNYGGRDEITRAVRLIAKDVKEGKIDPEQIQEEDVSKYLDTKRFGDPDMLVRTGGESRLSNFLLWQLSYTEVHICQCFWPDFTPQEFLEQVYNFQNRERRFGVL
jgi:undecaprenyl diphosphate synthase